MTPGQRIRELRRARDWTQAELGVSMEVTKQRIHQIESGRVHASAVWRRRCAEVLDVSPAELVPELIVDATQPAMQIELALDGSHGGPDNYARWVPIGDDDTALMKQLGLRPPTSPATLVSLLRDCAAAKIAVRFRGDFFPLA